MITILGKREGDYAIWDCSNQHYKCYHNHKYVITVFKMSIAQNYLN